MPTNSEPNHNSAFNMECSIKSVPEEIEYKVEEVVDKRTIPCNGGCDGIIGCKCGGRIEYRIKWLGYGPESNTWEPLKHLYCEDLIEEFEAKLIDRKTFKGVKSKVSTPRLKSIMKRKSSLDKSVSLDDWKPNFQKGKQRKDFSTTIDRSVYGSKSLVKNARKKSVDFKEPIITKSEVWENVDKKQARRRSDGQVDPSLQPEKIIGAADSGGELMFLIKWKGVEKADLVPAREANTKFTDMVVKFYEDRIQWHAGHLVASSTSD